MRYDDWGWKPYVPVAERRRKAVRVMEKVTLRSAPDIRFFHMDMFNIAGHSVHALRHGMVGQPGWELFMLTPPAVILFCNNMRLAMVPIQSVLNQAMLL